MTAHDKARWDAVKRTLRHLMIAAAILGVAAALLFLILADVVCLGDFCRSCRRRPLLELSRKGPPAFADGPDRLVRNG